MEDRMDIDKITMCLKGNTKILLNKSDGKRIIAGYANVAIVDQENQYIPLAVLQKGIQSLLADSSYANLMIMHKNIQIGKIIPTYGKYKTGVDSKGLFIVCEIRKDIKVADEIWGMILKKEISGFSIGCEVLLSHKVCDEKECVTVLDKINIFEVSVCTEPVNQKSGFSVISKSEYEKFRLDSNMLNVDNIGKSMEEVIKKDAVPCTDCAQPVELSIEERLESLEQKMMEFLEMAKKKPEEEKVPPAPCQKAEELAKPPVPPVDPNAPPVQDPNKPPQEQPQDKPPEKPAWSSEEDMAMFMLDYIIKNPKSSAQDVAKAWMKMKGKTREIQNAVPEPVPTQEPLMESLMKKVDTLSEKLSKLDYTEELKSSLKVRDDAIQALEKKIEIITKSKEPEKKQEQEIKTVQSNKEPVLEKDEPIHIKDGIVTSSEFM
jgi:HK97 family phage prohead protease